MRRPVPRRLSAAAAHFMVDWPVNRGRHHIQLALVLFRVAAASRARFGSFHPLSVALGATYKVIVEWGLGIELPWATEVGPRLTIHHGQGIVVNPCSSLGSDVEIRHAVTIGNRREATDCPTIGDGVSLGAGCAVLGAVTIGDGAVIGAHALVLIDVPPGAVAVGNPARILPSDR